MDPVSGNPDPGSSTPGSIGGWIRVHPHLHPSAIHPWPAASGLLWFPRPGPASPRQGGGLLGHPAGLGQGLAQQHLDLGVHAPELVVGPAGQRIVHRRVDSEQNLAAVTHV